MKDTLVIHITGTVEHRLPQHEDYGTAASTIVGAQGVIQDMDDTSVSNLVIAFQDFLRGLAQQHTGRIFIKMGAENLIVPPLKNE